MDTLEHVEYPHTALKEIHRILHPDGIAVISSVMKWHIHDHPFDYWRFTPEAFKSLLKPFSSSYVGFAGVPKFPHTVVGIGFRGQQPDMKRFEDQYMLWHARQTPTRGRLGEFVNLFVPPILLHVTRRIVTALQSP
jgi:ubiquinone/menaquinone biosynthesis C-methylase UbiE